MRTIEELHAFAEGYLQGTLACNADLRDWDDWVIWHDYDINFVGQDYTSADVDNKSLLVVVYPAGWEGSLPDPIHTFTVGESK